MKARKGPLAREEILTIAIIVKSRTRIRMIRIGVLMV
jgi:hypothetical protein